MSGFDRGRNLDKLGLHCQDTSELSFTDVAVPKVNVLGDVGRGFEYLMRNLAQERMQIAVGSLGRVRAALDWTVDYVRERVAFGKPIGALQNTRFALADAATEFAVDGVVRRPLRARTECGSTVRGRRRQGETVGHRDGVPGARQLPAAVRRLRLHAGVSDRPSRERRPRHPRVRRHLGDHARDHRPRPSARPDSRRDRRREPRGRRRPRTQLTRLATSRAALRAASRTRWPSSTATSC